MLRSLCALTVATLCGCHSAHDTHVDLGPGLDQSDIEVDLSASQELGVDAAAIDGGDGDEVDGGVDASMKATLPTVPMEVTTAGCATNVFFDDFDDLSTIDLKNTQAAGFNWYITNATNGVTTPVGMLTHVAFGTNGSLHIDGTNPGAGVLGATRSTAHGAVGKSFAVHDDGCTYFEARIALAIPAKEGGANVSWPAWWALPTRHMQNLGLPWAGQANTDYDHYVELDILEMNAGFQARSTIIDWYGQYNKATPTCNMTGYCKTQDTQTFGANVEGTFDSPEAAPVFHRFGALWTPSLQGVSGYSKGSMTWFVDGVKSGIPVTWTGPPSTTNLDPTGQPWRFSVMDEQGFSLTLNTGSGAYMDVDYAGVWQKP